MPEQYQDSQEQEFQSKRRHLSKDEQIYGVFTEAYDSHIPIKQSRKQTKTEFTNFRAGERINPNQSQIQINVPKQPKKKKVTFSSETIVHTFQKQQPQQPVGMFTLDSFLNSRLQFADEQQPEQQQQKVEQKPLILTQKIKKHLKLVKFSQYKKVKDMAQYGLPEHFGSKMQKLKVEKKIKTEEELKLESEFTNQYGIGFKMLSKMGFNVKDGLGKDGTGIKAPVQALKKDAFVSRDEEMSIVVPQEQQQPEQQQETKAFSKGPREIFEYFSENDEINKFINFLKNQYEMLQVSLMNQQQQVEKLENEVYQAENQIILNENQAIKTTQKINQLNQLKSNLFSCQKFPHLALKFNIDLLMIKMTIEQSKTDSFQELMLNCDRFIASIKQTIRKLKKFYLQKQKQTIANFSRQPQMKNFIYDKIINIENLQNKAVISQQNLTKINRFTKIMVQEIFLLKLIQRLKGWSIDQQTQEIIHILQRIGNVDKQIKQEILTNYIYPQIDEFMSQITLNFKIPPHLLVFPWFTVITPSKINYKSFCKRLSELEWKPQELGMLNLITPWKPYMDKQIWDELINLTIAPRILHMMDRFYISVSAENAENLNKLKAIMKYATVLQIQHIQAILEPTLMLEIQNTYHELLKRQTQQSVNNWVDNWKKTIKKIKNYPTSRLDRLIRVE